jgi:cytochrome c oxidase subunit II
VFGLVLFTLVRYRRRGDEVPPGREGPPIVEGLYALVLAGVVVFLLAMTFRTDDRVIEVSADPGVEVDVTAFQWGWRFTYPDEDVTVVGDDRRPPTLVVPLDTTVQFTLTSRDVIHAFWIPEVRFKRDAFPDRETTFDLSFEEEDMTGRCAEFCGLAHGEMTFDVVAMDSSDFDDWLRTQRRAGEIQHGVVR